MQTLRPILTQKGTLVLLALLGAIAVVAFLLARQNVSLPWGGGESSSVERSALQEVIANPSPESKGVEGYAEYISTLLASAQEADVLEVGECSSVEPLVLQVRYGELVRMRNSAASVRTLTLENGERYRIEPRSEEEVLINFYHEDGVYPYACDGWRRAGVFLVLPQGDVTQPSSN